MDLFVDPDGVVMVRSCGCPKHGLNSLWDDHDENWKKQNRKTAEEIVVEHGKRDHLGRGRAHLDAALVNIRDKKVK